MELFICAQDIQFITFGLVDRVPPPLAEGEGWGGIVFQKTFEVPPEKYLASLDHFLHEQQMSSADVSRILIVNGPGSFTASRVSVVIANTFAFAREIPVVAIENPERLSMEKLLPLFAILPEHSFVIPVYDKPPNIT